jgi:hypothetical protein
LETFLKILSVIALSSVKFLGGPPLAYGYKFNFFEIIGYTVIGGMIGVVVVSYFSNLIVKFWYWLKYSVFSKKDPNFSKPTVDLKGNIRIKYLYNKPHKKQLVFTPRNRQIVRIWMKYGLIGIAAITPVVLSIPIGTFFATRLARHRRRVFTYMFFSILLWSLLITAILYKLIPLSPEIITQ